MKSSHPSFSRALIGVALGVAALLSGCAVNMKVPIKDPVVSATQYEKAGELPPVALAFKDARPEPEKKAILGGTIPMQLVYQDKPFDALPWLSTQVTREMVARGLPVTQAGAGESGTEVLIRRAHIENYRSNGFSPFITFTSLRADVQTPKGLQRVTAYVKRGKVPVWSFDEIIDPTFNTPLGLVAKELAAKLNQQLYGQVVSDATVKALLAKLKQNNAAPEDAYLDVYELGFSNNPIAIPELAKLVTHSSEYVRLAAISSLGILKAADQLPLLMAIYESKDNIWQDRAMALKSIGDIGTPRAFAYMRKQSKSLGKGDDKEVKWTREILRLYRK
ncbi:HEAT repeat domain-containing protein [Herbaspirillum sp. YR522]|uniref:HEAT repeat domain-containing protein n=1 Tax=Herbaspirillum sp. YR522 TaxID=1144342 RepID=UPI00026FAACD|nr:HEAT repeat domain-containing protein [Herbaspirillum sp. YR522]EJN07897.1 hypothetical protein PMI40_01650 [Herbaspirillum sp. YR522]